LNWPPRTLGAAAAGQDDPAAGRVIPLPDRPAAPAPLPADDRPVPDVARYDQLLHRRASTTPRQALEPAQGEAIS
jgi:hypothetical protein